MSELDIIQENSWEFKLKNWPRSISLSYDQVAWIYDGDFLDIPEFDIKKAKHFYKKLLF